MTSDERAGDQRARRECEDERAVGLEPQGQQPSAQRHDARAAGQEQGCARWRRARAALGSASGSNARQPRGIPDDEQRAQVVEDGREQRVQQAERSEHDAARIHAERDRVVLSDDPDRLLAQAHGRAEPAEIV